MHFRIAPFLLLALLLLACGQNSGEIFDNSDQAFGFSKFDASVQVFEEDEMMVIEADGVPDHKSPYFSNSDAQYEAYNGMNPDFFRNPNSIEEQTLTFRIPKNPQEASTHEATSLGPIGVTVNGVPIFNQYAGPGDDLAQEANSFDQYNGHPQQSGMYHYHIEPVWLTDMNGPESLIGYLLDGFPVYGPEENGSPVTNQELDSFHGHFSATAEYPEGIYHYHITSEYPYINGDGYFGTPGTVSL